MKKLIIVIFTVLIAVSTATTGDLYKVKVHSQKDANNLKAAELEVLLKVADGYLVLVDRRHADALEESGLDVSLQATSVERDHIVVDKRFDNLNTQRFEVLYEDGPTRLLKASSQQLAQAQRPIEVYPLLNQYIHIEPDHPFENRPVNVQTAALADVELLMAQINQDSLQSYTEMLQAFMVRLAGTPENYASRDWIAAKFEEFGYSPADIEIDPFTGYQCWEYNPVPSFNVIARKTGTVFPDQHIIIGGHFDAVPDSPGADDNASGAAAVMEMARVLQGVETAMSFVFFAIDCEEAGLHGARHYVYEAIDRHEDIVIMINLDMIAHLTNSNRANIYFGEETTYATLWHTLASTYCGIDYTDLLSGGASDQRAFWQAGYNAMFVQEDIFSPNWHQPDDSTVYMNFEYMTRMTQASLGTALTIDLYPPPIVVTSLMDPGDGQSMFVEWQAVDPSAIDYYRLSWLATSDPGNISTIDLPSTQTSYTVTGLAEGQAHVFYVEAFDIEGNTSFSVDRAYGTPNSVPKAPVHVLAMPLSNGVKITWFRFDDELDFDHCDIVRDGVIIGETTEREFVDNNPALGTDLHYYQVMATDTDGIQSDTIGIEPSCTKAATLQPDRILAVNRTSIHPVDFVDEVETGVFMREALEGYNFDYCSDTFATICPSNCERLSLVDMVDYGLVVIGAEAARYDDIAIDPVMGGVLDSVAYYLSIGGKAIIFGRWGDEKGWDTLDYANNAFDYDDSYASWFDIDHRVKTTTTWPVFSTELQCDMIGAHANTPYYPYLAWDSLATIAHSNDGSPNITDVGGIPCVSFMQPSGGGVDVIYTYDSRGDDPSSEGKPVAWRYLGSDYRYIVFDIPLSFCERTAAKAALCRAVEELRGNTTAVDDDPFAQLPGSFGLSQNYPNPFNPETEILYSLPTRSRVNLSIYNVLGQRVATIVDEEQAAGPHRVKWNGTDDRGHALATGIYLYQIKAEEYTESKKMVLLK